MGIRISDMTPYSGIPADGDLLEMTDISEKKTYSVSMQTLGEYLKTQNNGGFKSATSKSLDDFKAGDVGVYYWTGSPYKDGMPGAGMLEVFTNVKIREDSTETPVVVQRLTSLNEMFIRSFDTTVGNWTDWGVCRNRNGNTIVSGYSTDSNINFNNILGRTSKDGPYFSKTPTVTVTPFNTTTDKLFVINVNVVDNTGFSVVRYASDLNAVVTQTTETKTESESTSTTTSTTETTRGAWVSAEFGYYWTATLDG